MNLACIFASVVAQDFIDEHTKDFAMSQLHEMTKTSQGLVDLKEACNIFAGTGNVKALDYLKDLIKNSAV
ncbi:MULTISPECIES: hypothetical protein [unclassified Fibrobacter]|uniref:hypothetical protein n=1 Tax=unclassified Fibrobacter TaxID=2634177 RepID=UPI00091805E5|nr:MULTISPECIES: hypothetical protein [Fibrobacter]MCL4100892.1 hypothetical protein [Fibrobacter succinogenes]MCQ2098950.1 hypothetical protein [Fibrobacter sp.]SHK70625.1 hypothetical protein SAMN05720765_104164 [Fibrobacter sp. UWH6]